MIEIVQWLNVFFFLHFSRRQNEPEILSFFFSSLRREDAKRCARGKSKRVINAARSVEGAARKGVEGSGGEPGNYSDMKLIPSSRLRQRSQFKEPRPRLSALPQSRGSRARTRFSLFLPGWLFLRINSLEFGRKHVWSDAHAAAGGSQKIFKEKTRIQAGVGNVKKIEKYVQIGKLPGNLSLHCFEALLSSFSGYVSRSLPSKRPSLLYSLIPSLAPFFIYVFHSLPMFLSNLNTSIYLFCIATMYNFPFWEMR